jgi:hypothetical protein
LAGLFSAVTGGVGRDEDGAKVGLPSLDLSLAFPQATPASIFPPSGETFIHFFPLNFAGIRSEGIVSFGLGIGSAVRSVM